jgi:hypothetical protein
LGGQTWNHECTQDAPCGSLQRAVDLAADPANAGKPVTIHLGPGTFGSPAADVHVHAGSLSALTITGYGSTGTTATVLIPGAADPGHVEALRIDPVSFPVTVSGLSIGPAQGATGTATANSTSVHGIRSLSVARLTVDDVRIADLTGGDGAAGSPGGDAIGIAHAGPATITRTTIAHLRGGQGGRGSDGATPNPGAIGGAATSVAVDPPPGGALTVSQSQFTDNIGGAGGPGGGWSDGNHRGVPGGAGGAAMGVRSTGGATSIDAVTVARMQGGWGGPGGLGHARDGATAVGTDGAPGAGGDAAGLLLTGVGTATAATMSVINSTIGDNTGGPGADGGHGVGIGLGLTDGGTGRASLVHNTVVNNVGAPGAPGASGGVIADGPDVVLAASLLNNLSAAGAAVNCSNVGPGTLTDDGYNALSDHTAPTCGTAPTDVATTAADLGPLHSNGGPTETRALIVGSAAATAVDGAGPADYCAGSLFGLDQRLLARPAGRCAAGAFEPPASPAAPKPVAPPSTPVTAKPTPTAPVVAPTPHEDKHRHGRWAPAPYKGPKTKIAPGHHKRHGKQANHRHHGKRRG